MAWHTTAQGGPHRRCHPRPRRTLPDTRLAEINQIAATTGDDPELDTLILRLHTEAACAAARWPCACLIWTSA